jgi:energy-coupling factor transport system permease protein
MLKLSFQPGNSLIHQLYPLTKFAWLIVGTLIVFIIQDGRLLMISAGVFTIILILTNRNIWRVRGFRFAFLTGAALLILYLLFEKSGQVVLDPGIPLLMVTSEGIMLGLRFSGRFITIVVLSYIFILTTDPGDLAYALMKVGLPYRYGFMLVTALRLAPVLEDEGRIIYQAQLVRGIHYDQANIRKVLLLAQQFMTPLLISALRRADKLVFSMEGRGFGAQSTRTFRKRPIPTQIDLYISIGLTLFFTTLLAINFGRAS